MMKIKQIKIRREKKKDKYIKEIARNLKVKKILELEHPVEKQQIMKIWKLKITVYWIIIMITITKNYLKTNTILTKVMLHSKMNSTHNLKIQKNQSINQTYK